jgi:hypothetical protein
MTLFPATRLENIKRPADLPEWQQFRLDYDPDANIPGNNAVRAGFASTGIIAFAKRVGLLNDEGGVETAISDFLGDLMHLCDALDITFEDMVSMGAFHYDAELRGEL